MCGIAGILSLRPLDPHQVRRMTDPIAHRGPDDEGVWIDAQAGIGLGHRRLSIVDLSPSGHQPMHSASERFVLIYNGEIYNHAAVRRELEEAGPGGPRNWRGHSDTETLIEAISLWGLQPTLEKCVGMFAFALWDRESRTLQLGRDRFGEKPLYYGWVGGDFTFGSELKALRSHPRFANPIDREALSLLASRMYVPAPRSIYQGIFKLEPGCILGITPEGARTPRSEPPVAGSTTDGLRIDRYWSYRDVVADGLADPIANEGEALEALDRALGDAIKGQSVADVPVGAFLSGGIDSSTVVALYHKHARGKVRTFSIGFEDERFNEAHHAAAVAAHFGTEHNERYVTVAETRDVIPGLPRMYDEPFADASQIPTHLVSRFAREQVTVALSGDGGDELFGGYDRYLAVAKMWSYFDKVPGSLRGGIGRSLSSLPPAAWDGIAAALPGKRPSHFGLRVQKNFRLMGAANSLDDVFDNFLDEWNGESSPVTGVRPSSGKGGFDLDIGAGAPDVTRMMYCDAMSYLPDDILCKVDRASMACSLETRVPFLDHRVAAVAARIPESMKVRNGKGKMILRDLLYREAPRELFERPKAGFGVPVGQWLRGPLRGWAEELLDSRRLAEDGFFDAGRIRNRWEDHLSGRRDATQALWAVLMFQAWRGAEIATEGLPASRAA